MDRRGRRARRRQAFFPPLLGTGGNDGRLEFSTNFHEQLIQADRRYRQEPGALVTTAMDLLAGTQRAPLAKAPIGQFDPATRAARVVAGSGPADSLANPWSFVLVVEGSLLFAASAARRNQHAAGRAAMPFTVSASPEGSASGASGEESRGELWAPVWHEDVHAGRDPPAVRRGTRLVARPSGQARGRFLRGDAGPWA